jgi:cytochrome c biogenesis protein CcdA
VNGLAFAAGMVAALNPCGFAMLPAYLILVIRDEAPGRLIAVGRALAATATMTLGFVVVFAMFGLLTVPAATAIQRNLPYVTVTIGVILVVIGGWLVSGREFMLPRIALLTNLVPTAKVGSMFGYGVAYAIASLSCTIGPFLAVTASSLESGRIVDGLVAHLAYAAGLGLVVGALALLVALAGTELVRQSRRILKYVNRFGGALTMLVGLYVAYYGLYEIRLIGPDGDPRDSIISAAGRIQRAVAGWVYLHGPWPWVIGIGVIGVAIAIRAAIRARSERAGNSSRPVGSSS